MRTFRRLVFVFAAVIAMVGLVGCSLMPHFMQPHQLQKLNRGANGTPASDWD